MKLTIRQQMINYYADNPYEFIEDMIGVTPSPQQEKVLRIIPQAIKEKKGITVKSGHGCFGKGTKILMYDGTIKKVEDVKVGEQLMGDDSTPRNVLELKRGQEELFEFELISGEKYIFNKSHILCLVASQTHGKQKYGYYSNPFIYDWVKWSDRKKRTNCFYKKKIIREEKELKINPYILGVWLGDGLKNSPIISNIDIEVIDSWFEEAKKRGFDVNYNGIYEYHMTNGPSGRKKHSFLEDLKYYNLLNNKHIPQIYLNSSIEQRLQILAGLLDTDGYLDKRKKRVYQIIQKNKLLSEQILYLARSVGCHATIKKVKKSWIYKGIKKYDWYYNIHITRNIEIIPCRVKHKIAKQIPNQQRNNLHFGIRNVKTLGIGNYYGFVLDGNHKFLSKDLFVLHNTGKTCMQSWLINWFMTTRPHPRVITTAPTQRQLFDVLWSELSKWHKKNKFGGMFEYTNTMLRHKNHSNTWFATARSSNKPENMQGFHAEHLLFLLDEACHDDKTMVMTEDGWKYFKDLTDTDLVLTLNPDNKKTKFQKPIKNHVYNHNGEMYLYERKGGNFCVTPNHRFHYKINLRSNKSYFEEIQNIKSNHFNIKKDMYWEGIDKKYFVLNEIKSIKGIGKGKTTKYYPQRNISMEIWAEFLGWYLYEGCIQYVKNIPYSVQIAQKIKNNRKEIISLIKNMGYTPKETENGILINSKQLALECIKYGKKFDKKHIPLYFKKLDKKYLDIFLESFCKGDGYSKTDYRDIFYTSSKKLALDLHEITLKAGYSSVIRKRKIKNNKVWVKDHYAVSSCNGYIISKSKKLSHIKVRQKNIQKIQYKGKVYCVTVPKYNIILTMRDGYPMWSGNSGIPEDVMEVIEGTQSQEGSLVMMFGNPTQISGGFYDSFHDKRPFYFCFTFSAKDAENFYLPSGIRLVDPMNNQKIAMKYGEDSNVYRVRVLGEFSKSDPDTLISLDIVEKAAASEVERPLAYEVVEYGMDVARFGDDESGIYRRVGNVLEEVIIDGRKCFWRKNDIPFLIGIGVRLIKEQSEDKFVKIYVDDSGVGGGVTDGIKERIKVEGLRAEVIGVNNGSKAPNDDKYANLGTEMWFKMKDWLKEANIPNDNDLIAQISTRKFKQLSNGKLMLESKQEMKKRGLTSPDRADAAILTLRSLVSKYINVDRSNMFRVG